jgi:hypothetical protein
MIVECLSIVAILLAIIIIFVRTGKTKYAITTLPLILVPLLHILFVIVAPDLSNALSFDKKFLIVALDITNLIISCILLGALSHKITTKRTRITYLISCGAFLVILSWVLSLNTLLK